MFANDLTRAAICQWNGIIYAAGWADGAVWFKYSEDGGRSASLLPDGSTRARVCAAEQQQPAIEVLTTSELVVAVDQGGEVAMYFSSDQGATWQPAQ
jgi:hypothetical protein